MRASLKGKNVVITGAVHGIGASLAALLAKEGCNLFLIDKKNLTETVSAVKNEKIKIISIVKDLSLSKSREEVFFALEKEGFDVDILINNVGIGYWRYFQDTSWDKTEQIIDINVKCMTHMTKLILPGMLKKNSGFIVNLSSTAAFIGAPNGVCYSATKAYIRIFSETLSLELEGTGVNTLCVFAGATDTHFWPEAMMEKSNYHEKVSKMTAGAVAKETIQAMKSGKSSVITGNTNKLNMFIANLLPRKILKQIALKRFKG